MSSAIFVFLHWAMTARAWHPQVSLLSVILYDSSGLSLLGFWDGGIHHTSWPPNEESINSLFSPSIFLALLDWKQFAGIFMHQSPHLVPTRCYGGLRFWLAARPVSMRDCLCLRPRVRFADNSIRTKTAKLGVHSGKRYCMDRGISPHQGTTLGSHIMSYKVPLMFSFASFIPPRNS